jgi:hypothetical protein
VGSLAYIFSGAVVFYILCCCVLHFIYGQKLQHLGYTTLSFLFVPQMYALHVRGMAHVQRLVAVDAGADRNSLVNPCIMAGKNYTQTG